MINWKDLKYFTKSEFKSPEKMSASLLYKLDCIRADAKIPIFITSSYRKDDLGAHGEGVAVDISDNLKGDSISSRWRYKILVGLIRHGIHRIGIYDRHIHLDMDESRDKEVCWWGTSD